MKEAHANGNGHGHHIVPIKTYVGLLVLLLILMVATIAAYNFDFCNYLGDKLGTFVNNGVALTIAITKASLVIAIFMGVKYASKLTKLYAYLGFIWVGLMGIAFCDYATRHTETDKGWEGREVSPITNMILPKVDPEAVKRAHVTGDGGGH